MKVLECFKTFKRITTLSLTFRNRDLSQIQQCFPAIKNCKSLLNIYVLCLFNNFNIEFQRFQSFLTSLKVIKPLKSLKFSFAYCGNSLSSKLNDFMPALQEISETANVEFLIQDKDIQILPKQHFRTFQNIISSKKIDLKHFSEPHLEKVFFVYILPTLIIILFAFLKQYLF